MLFAFGFALLLFALAGGLAVRIVARPRAAALAGLAPAAALGVAVLWAGPGGPSIVPLDAVVFAFFAGLAYVGWLLGVRSAGTRARPTQRSGRVAAALCGAALLWGALLLVAAFTYPAYSGVGCGAEAGSPGQPPVERCVETSATIVEMNGLSALIPLGVPLVAAAAVTLLLSLRCRRGGRGPLASAAALIVLLFAFGFATGFSIGLYVLPLVPVLAAAAALTPAPSRARAAVA